MHMELKFCIVYTDRWENDIQDGVEVALRNRVDAPHQWKFPADFIFYLPTLGHAVRSWLRHYTTSQKVAGSIPDEVIGFLIRPNTSSRTTALGSTQPQI
jgi:hypothetical protein